MKKTKILMVCLGNICRSPLEEGVLRSKLRADRFEVDSAGTSDYHIGTPPDERSIASAKKHGIDISILRGRQFTVNDFANFDYIFVRDKFNYKNIIKKDKTTVRKERETQLAKIKANEEEFIYIIENF